MDTHICAPPTLRCLICVLGATNGNRQPSHFMLECAQIMVVACMLAIPACGRFSSPNRNLKSQVTESAVIGTWTLTANSLALFKRDGFAADNNKVYTITFNGDGTLSIASIRRDLGGPCYVEASGTWALEHDTMGDSNVRKVNALRLEYEVSGISNLRFLNFAEEEGDIRLWQYYGDPDEWEFIEYIRDT